MKKWLSVWQLAGLTFTAVLGTLLHFLYDWTGSPLVAPFSAVNESTWEHMKILFFPMLLFAVVQSVFFKTEYENFWLFKAVGILVGTFLIPVLFYTYNGAIGDSPDWLNITFFFIAAGAAYLLEYLLFKTEWRFVLPPVLAKAALALLALLFVAFTYFPPQIPLFQDPIAKFYGLNVCRTF